MATCDQCRKALSARMDGEEPGLPDGALDVRPAHTPSVTWRRSSWHSAWGSWWLPSDL